MYKIWIEWGYLFVWIGPLSITIDLRLQSRPVIEIEWRKSKE